MLLITFFVLSLINTLKRYIQWGHLIRIRISWWLFLESIVQRIWKIVALMLHSGLWLTRLLVLIIPLINPLKRYIQWSQLIRIMISLISVFWMKNDMKAWFLFSHEIVGWQSWLLDNIWTISKPISTLYWNGIVRTKCYKIMMYQFN